ncbi:MAG: ChaB family protein [Thermoproteota archaeon]|nr:ChaB family protein [Thermoproteota archaeon]
MPRGKKLSGRTKKQISHLPKHAQRVYEKTHERTLEHYRSPEKRKGRSKCVEAAAEHKVAWTAAGLEERARLERERRARDKIGRVVSAPA